MLEPVIYIIINNKRKLHGCYEFSIKCDVDEISTKAYVSLPYSTYLQNKNNEKLDIKTAILPGDRISIIAGYKEDELHQFDLYATLLNVKDDVRIDLEDEIYLFRKTPVTYSAKKVSVKEVCEYLVAQVNKNFKTNITVSAASTDMIWDEISYKGNAAGLLYEMKEKTYQTVNFNKGELYIGGQQLLYTGEALKKLTIKTTYGVSIITNEVSYQTEDSKPLKVIMKGKKKDNTETVVKVGQDGGDVRTEMHADITDYATLKKMAESYYKLHCFTGFTGSITLCFIPFATAGGTVIYKNNNYKDFEGKYFIKAVEYKFGVENGLEQIVNLGQKL